MSRSNLAVAVLVATTAFAATLSLAAASPPSKHSTHGQAAMPPASDQALIKSAMHAAPHNVGSKAKIVVMQPDGSLRTLREGSNGFTCMPDSPTTPGPDSMCMDANAWEWAGAWMGHQTPPSGKVGFMYMLEGGTDASNTDPYATEPATGKHWVKTGAHVMIVGADQAFYDQYPKDADPDTSVPYVMWSGTPYQHLMIPVK